MNRRFQFSLRTLFMVMLATATFFAGIQFERERRKRQDLEEASNDTTMFPHGVQTVRVRIAGVASFANRIDEKLVAAVERRIETITPYKLVNDNSEFDSELSITVANQGPSQLSGDDGIAPIVVKWVDKQGSTLRPPTILRPNESLDERTIPYLAREIVGQMEASW